MPTSAGELHQLQGADGFRMRYRRWLPDGDVPLTFHFTGRILYQGPQRQVQVVHLPWSTSASYKLPVATCFVSRGVA